MLTKSEPKIIESLRSEQGVIVRGKVSLYSISIRRTVKFLKLIAASIVLNLPTIIWQLFVDINNVPLLWTVMSAVAFGVYMVGFVGAAYAFYLYLSAILAHLSGSRYSYYRIDVVEGTPIEVFKKYSSYIVWCTRGNFILRVKTRSTR